jgi:hypothetical protein
MHQQKQQQQDYPAAAAALALALPAAFFPEQLLLPSTAAAAAAAAAPADEEEGEELALPYYVTDGAYNSSTACTHVTAAINEALMHPGMHAPPSLGMPATAGSGASTRNTSAANVLQLSPRQCQKQQPRLAQLHPMDASRLEERALLQAAGGRAGSAAAGATLARAAVGAAAAAAAADDNITVEDAARMLASMSQQCNTANDC